MRRAGLTYPTRRVNVNFYKAARGSSLRHTSGSAAAADVVPSPVGGFDLYVQYLKWQLTRLLVATVLPTVPGVCCYKQQGAAASGVSYAYATVG